MTMKEIGELGYFIIKYIQDFNLDEGVGVDKDHPTQICFIPDNPLDGKLDYNADDQVLNEFEERTNERLAKIRNESFILWRTIFFKR